MSDITSFEVEFPCGHLWRKDDGNFEPVSVIPQQQTLERIWNSVVSPGDQFADDVIRMRVMAFVNPDEVKIEGDIRLAAPAVAEVELVKFYLNEQEALDLAAFLSLVVRRYRDRDPETIEE